MASLKSDALFKYDPNQPRDESGKWTATGASGGMTGAPSVQSAPPQISAPVDFALVSSMSRIENLTRLGFAEEYMTEEFQEALAYLETNFQNENPDAVFVPDFLSDAVSKLDVENRREDMLDELREIVSQQVTELYSINGTTKDGEYWESIAENVSIYKGEIEVQGWLYVDGKNAGFFRRKISESEAYRDYLQIGEKYSGLGIAKEFNKHEEEMYRASGIPLVRISAMDLSYGNFDQSPGTYAWASQGYDWSSTPNKVVSAVRIYVRNNPEYGELPAPIRKTVESVLSRMDTLNITDANYPTPREISQLGRMPDSDWWPGKSIMAHSGASEDSARGGGKSGPDWGAVKRLNEPLRTTEEGLAAERIRQEFAAIGSAGEAQRIAGLEQFKRANPRLAAGDEFITINGQPVPVEKSVGPMIDTVEKYDPMQPRDESGKWTATGGSGVSAGPSVTASQRAFPVDFSNVELLSSIEYMDLDDFIDQYMQDELQEAIYYLESDYEDENPNAAIYPDFSDEARQGLYEFAESQHEKQMEELQQVLLEQSSELYSIDGRGKNGEYWETDVEYVSVEDDTLEISGRFYVDGELAGQFERRISEFDAYRALLRIDEEYSGLGIASEFNKYEESMYREGGIPQVRISAADLSYGNFDQAPGTYVWASQGYDWSDTPFAVRNAVESYVGSNPEYQELPAPLRGTVDSVLSRMQTLDTNDENYPTPREISQLGRLPDSDWWAGKSIMAHSGAEITNARSGSFPGPRWNAVKRLNEPLRTTEAGNVAERVRQEFAEFGAAERAASIAQFRQMNPQLGFDPNFITINGMAIPLDLTDAQIERKLGI